MIVSRSYPNQYQPCEESYICLVKVWKHALKFMFMDLDQTHYAKCKKWNISHNIPKVRDT